MKKNILPLLFLCSSTIMFAQVGIGTKKPDQSALLDIQTTNNELKGVLIPRVSLHTLTDYSTLNSGRPANSLLVFNTTENDELTTGYYYWFDTSWIRLVTDQDNKDREIPKNEEFAVNLEEQTLYLKDSEQNVVSVPLSDINLVTTMESLGHGSYRYTAEDGTQTSIDVVEDVIANIATIAKDTVIRTFIQEQITAMRKPISGDAIIAVSNGEHAALASVHLGINNQSISTDKIKPGTQGQLLVTNKDGEVMWIDATDESIQEVLSSNQAIT
ncbi:hypothetical protein ACPDG4_08590, partial [Myroides sp. C20-1]